MTYEEVMELTILIEWSPNIRESTTNTRQSAPIVMQKAYSNWIMQITATCKIMARLMPAGIALTMQANGRYFEERQQKGSEMMIPTAMITQPIQAAEFSLKTKRQKRKNTIETTAPIVTTENVSVAIFSFCWCQVKNKNMPHIRPIGMTTYQYRSIHSHIVLTLSKFLSSLLHPTRLMPQALTIFQSDVGVAHAGSIGSHKVRGSLLAGQLRPALKIELQLIATLCLIACLIRLVCDLQMTLEILLHPVVCLDYTK